jgi:predicted acylesterase/phospholipase RssA
MSFTSIVIAGGALKVLSAIGCVKYLQEKQVLGSLRNFVGTSAGAVLCFFLALGYKWDEILQFAVENLYNNDIMSVDVDDMFNVLTTYGLSQGESLKDFFVKALYKKLKRRDITFMEAAKSLGKNIVICVSNLTKEQSEYISVDTHPDMSVIDALRISCSIPFFFTPVTMNECIYVDGALYNNFPMSYFSSNMLKDIIGINIINKNYQKNDNFISFSLFILNSVISKINQTTYNDEKNNIVTIDIEDTPWFSFTTFSFSFPKEKIQEYVQTGYDIAKSRIQ